MMVAVLCLASPQAIGWTEFKDGAIHNINYPIYDDVWVDWKAPGMQTTVNLLDGAYMPSDYKLIAFEDSRINITGGSIGRDLSAGHNSQVTLSGGSIGRELLIDISATLTIHGWDFAVDGQPFGYGELTSILGGWYYNEPYRHLTGILASGDLLDNDFYIGHDARIVLVPEPASAVILGLGSLFFSLRRRCQ
jgi:hypothetical protein